MSARPDLDELIDAALLNAQTEKLDEVDPRALAWLVVLPDWSDDLAGATTFPAADLDRFLESVQRAGWCDVRFDRVTRARRFLIKEGRRDEVVDACHTKQIVMADVVDEVYGRLRSAGSALVLSPHNAAWLSVLGDRSQSRSEADFSEEFYRRVDQACARNDTAEAQDLIAAGEVLAAALGGVLDRAVHRARRRIDRQYRQQIDLRRLARYLPRDSWTSEFDRLMTDESSAAPWALHLLGPGGVGKTMFIRWLMDRLAKGVHGPVVTARIDFDRINPRYPSERPGQLLAEFAEELAPAATSNRADDRLSGVDEAVRAVHRELDAGSATPAIGEHGQLSNAMAKAVDAFIELCAELPGRVVLVLDTCEELAKDHPAGKPVEGVVKTFQLLEALHQRDPRLRFVLAGRRPLAAGTHGDPPADAGLRPTELADRAYLKVVFLTGFNRSDVDTFLSQRGLRLSDQARERFFTSASIGATDTANPFEVDLFARMLEEAAPSTREQLEFDVRSYIRSRIVGRLTGAEEMILPTLPAAALFGRFDADMIDPCVRDDLGEVMRRLAGQEWIEAERGTNGQLWLTFDPGLRERMIEYFARTTDLDALTSELGRALTRLVRERPFDQLDVDHVAWAMRLSPGPDAARLWDFLEGRAERDHGWSLLSAAATRLRGLAPTERWRDSAMATRASLLATQLAYSRRETTEFMSGGLWADVVAEAATLPDPRLRQTLVTRARLGIVVDQLRSGTDVEPADLDFVFALVSSQDVEPGVAAGLVSVLDAYLDRSLDRSPLEQGSLSPLRSVPGWPSPEWARAMDPSLQAYATGQAARFAASATDVDTDRVGALFVWASELAIAADRPGDRDHDHHLWADWVPPTALLDRIRLHWLLSLTRSGLHALDTIGDWDLDPDSNNIDRERLASLALRSVLATFTPDDDLISAIGLDRRPPEVLISACLAHRQVPPAAVTVAEVLAARGDPRSALAQLQTAQYVGEGAMGTGSAAGAVGGGQALGQAAYGLVVESLRASVAIVRRWRIDDHQLILREAARYPELQTDVAEAQAVLDAVRRPTGYVSLLLGRTTSIDLTKTGMSALGAATLFDLDSERTTALLMIADDTARRGAGTVAELDRLDRIVLRHDRGLTSGITPRLDAYPRRSVELGLAEGEIVALRDPDSGLALLNQANQTARNIDDLALTFMTLLLLLLTDARQQGTTTAARTTELMQAYQRAAPERVSDDLGLKPLAPPSSSGSADPAVGVLAGLERRIAVLLALGPGGSRKVDLERLPGELLIPSRKSAGSRTPSSPGPESAPRAAPTATSPSAPSAIGAAPARLEGIRKIARLVKSTATSSLFLLSVLALAAVVPVVAGLGWWVVRPHTFLGRANLITSIGEASVIVLAAYPIGEQIYHRVHRWTALEVFTTPGYRPERLPSEGEDAPVVGAFKRVFVAPSAHSGRTAASTAGTFGPSGWTPVGTTLAVRIRDPIEWLAAWVAWAVRPPWTLKAARVSEQMQPSLAGMLARNRSRPSTALARWTSRQHTVVMRVGPEWVERDWESWRTGRERPDRVHHLRRYPVRFAPDATLGVRVIAARTWHSLAVRGWGSQLEVSASVRPDDQATVTSSTVVHLIGVPAQTSSGPRLRVNELRPGIKAAEPIDREILIGPEMISLAGSTVVLQLPPDRSVDANAPGDMRLIANDLMLAGAAAVILVPTLSQDRAHLALLTIAARVNRPRLDVREYLEICWKVRGALLADRQDDPGAWRDATGLTLFARY